MISLFATESDGVLSRLNNMSGLLRPMSEPGQPAAEVFSNVKMSASTAAAPDSGEMGQMWEQLHGMTARKAAPLS